MKKKGHKYENVSGIENVEIIVDGNKTTIVKSRDENKFMKWVGRGGKQSRTSVDRMVDQLRGRTDE